MKHLQMGRIFDSLSYLILFKPIRQQWLNILLHKCRNYRNCRNWLYDRSVCYSDRMWEIHQYLPVQLPYNKLFCVCVVHLVRLDSWCVWGKVTVRCWKVEWKELWEMDGTKLRVGWLWRPIESVGSPQIRASEGNGIGVVCSGVGNVEWSVLGVKLYGFAWRRTDENVELVGSVCM